MKLIVRICLTALAGGVAVTAIVAVAVAAAAHPALALLVVAWLAVVALVTVVAAARSTGTPVARASLEAAGSRQHDL